MTKHWIIYNITGFSYHRLRLQHRLKTAKKTFSLIVNNNVHVNYVCLAYFLSKCSLKTNAQTHGALSPSTFKIRRDVVNKVLPYGEGQNQRGCKQTVPMRRRSKFPQKEKEKNDFIIINCFIIINDFIIIKSR